MKSKHKIQTLNRKTTLGWYWISNCKILWGVWDRLFFKKWVFRYQK